MSTTAARRESPIDWDVIERWVINTPGATLSDAADRFEVSLRTVIRHGSRPKGNWIARQEQRFIELSRKADDRVVALLCQDKGDDARAFSEIQLRLQRVALHLVERLYPPEDAPVEVLLAAQARVDSLTGRDILRAVTDISRTLTETGRHLRLLAGKPTDIYERVGMPSIDVYIPATLEDARQAELMGRAAQQALRAAVNREAIDVESVVSPIPLDVGL